MDKKNTMLLTVIAVATLLVAVVGATFAFFTASNTATGTTSAETTTTKVGSVAFTGGGNLHIKLFENDMKELKDEDDNTISKTYWGTADPDKNYVDAAEKVESTKVVISGSDTTNVPHYSCDVTLTVTKGGQASELKSGDAQVVFTLSNGATIQDVTSGQPIDLTDLDSSYTLHYEKDGDTVAAGEVLLETAINFTNKTTAQDHFAGLGYTVSIENSAVDCQID